MLVGVIDSVRRADHEGMFWALFGQWVWLIFAIPISYGLTILPGIPLFYLLRRHHRSILSYWVGISSVLGFLIGALAAVSAGFVSPGQVSGLGAFAAVCAAINGAAFWHLALRPSSMELQR
jgi:hypothetical protein